MQSQHVLRILEFNGIRRSAKLMADSVVPRKRNNDVSLEHGMDS